MNGRSHLVPIIAVGVAAVWLLFQTTSPAAKPNGMRMEEFGALPCQSNGRVMPLDSFARDNLLLVNGGYTTFKDANDKEHSAVEWLLDLLVSQPPFFDPDTSQELPKFFNDRVYRIENDQIRQILDLKQREGLRYSYAEIMANGKYETNVSRLEKKETADYDDVDTKFAELASHVRMTIALILKSRVSFKDKRPRVLPPQTGTDTWMFLSDGIDERTINAKQFALILVAYQAGKAEDFNKALDDYQQSVDKTKPKEASKARFESFFNSVDPLKWCSVVYLFVLVLCFVSWVTWTKPLQSAAFWLTLFTWVIHTISLLGRMYLHGRPPVTNLYESAVFIGWGAVGLCLFLEYLNRNSIANVGAAVLGAATLFVAHFIREDNPDTLANLSPVLDTNWWLATHVVCVTLGYTATFVAGMLGVAFIILGVLTPHLDRDWIKALGQATYGVLCFATLLSFTGTVLGGIWADQSWGRFWGWDPKENGAVLIVIWNALILHARWSGLIKERGVAVLTVFGNIVTAWSWFGTNQLGVGLHAYGFNKNLATGCAFFWISQFIVMGVGMIPVKYWWSFAVARPEPKYTPAPVQRPTLKPALG